MNGILYDKVKEMVTGAKHILLLTDERIDGDTMGSTMGLYHVLNDAGKRVDVFSPKPLPPMFSYLPNVDVIRRDTEVFEQDTIDLVIISDCSDGEYIKALLPKMRRKVPLISFDHHATNPLYGTVNLVDVEAASTADVAWRFVKYAGYKASKEAAECFLTGIYTDTDVFTTSNTTTQALDASAELVKLGADPRKIVKQTMMNSSIPSLQLWGIVLSRLFHHAELNAVATAITLKDIDEVGATDEDIGRMSNFLNEVLEEKHEVVVVFYEKRDGSVKASMRSRGRDVSIIAEKHGGGGHKLAAAFKVPNASLEKTETGWRVVKKT
jgi:phosphoesterase RecJ-like protein